MLTKRTSEQRSNTGHRVLVTRAGDQATALSTSLKKIGVEAVTVSTIEIIPPPSFDALDQAISDLNQFDFLILTSVNAVKYFFERLSPQKLSALALSDLKIVAVGPKSAEALAERGISVDLIPKDYRAEGIVSLLKSQVSGKRILYPKAALARDLIINELTNAGADVIAPITYSSAPPADAAQKLQAAISEGLDLLTFTASSTVQNFVDLLDDAQRAQARNIPVASIGPLTTATAKKLGFNVVVEPMDSTLDDMTKEIKNYFKKL